MGQQADPLVPSLRAEFPGDGDRVIHDPNEWFLARFPDQVAKFGPAFVVGKWTDQQGNVNVIPLTLNEDLFASIIGDPSLGHSVVFYNREAQFYFLDPFVDAYCPTSSEKVCLLLSNYLIRVAQSCSRLVNVRPLVETFRSSARLSAVIDRAKVLLEADSSFFTGKYGNRRFVDGRYIGPTDVATHRYFVAECIEVDSNASVTVPDAFQRYRVFCDQNKLIALQRSEFKALVGEVIREQFHLGVRHDLDNGRGQVAQGWKGLCLVEPTSSPRANDE